MLFAGFAAFTLASCGGNKVTVNDETITLEDGIYAKLETSMGDILIDFHEDLVPMTAGNFIALSEGNHPEAAEKFQGKPYFDGTLFHRVIPDFMIQGGDFTNGDGTGGHAAKWYGYCNGQSGPSHTAESCPQADWSLPGEHTNGLKHGPGALAAAHAGLNTDGSQFYIVPSDSTPSHLDWNEGKDCSSASCHTVYGMVVSGMEHVDAISEVDTASGDTPVHDVRLVTAYRTATE